jgi:hypothetical protein
MVNYKKKYILIPKFYVRSVCTCSGKGAWNLQNNLMGAQHIKVLEPLN